MNLFDTEEPLKPRLWVGIDPGKSGGIVAMNSECQMKKWIIPLVGDSVDLKMLFDIFVPLKEKYSVTLILEEVHSIFGTSAGSNFTFGFVCGAIEAIVISHGLKLIKIAPKKWQAEIWQNSDIQYKALEIGKTKKQVNTKLTSLVCAKRLFPYFDFRKSDSKRVKNDHDGIIDACLLAEVGRRKNW